VLEQLTALRDLSKAAMQKIFLLEINLTGTRSSAQAMGHGEKKTP